MRKRRMAITLSLPPEMAEEFEKMATKESKNKSQLFRDMFRFYRELTYAREFTELQSYGIRKARERKVFSEKDVEKLVFAGR